MEDLFYENGMILRRKEGGKEDFLSYNIIILIQ